ncbi:hypothetical protein WK35_19770 [Burkholderia vietnamiensis]|nr:hypothetical protein WK35_19770 [Burkholderia vietnamiensis]
MIHIDLQRRSRMDGYLIIFPGFWGEAKGAVVLVSARTGNAQRQHMIRLHPELEVTLVDIVVDDWHSQSRLLSMCRKENDRVVVFERNTRHANGLTAQWIARHVATRQWRGLI